MDEPANSDISVKPSKKRGGFSRFIITTLVILGAGYFFYVSFLQNPCNLPIHYAIGSVDPKFKISSAEVKSLAEDAAGRWNSASGQALLVYDPSSTMKIDLVYDERQARVDQINETVGSLDSSGNAIETFRANLEAEIEQYQRDLAKYNSTVDYWNSQGGAPTATYNQLQVTKNQLDQRRQKINKSTSLLNEQINEHNSNLDGLNTRLDADKNKIVTEGLYYTQEKRIDIFTYGNKEELRLVIMHELGHALSLDHDALTASIMYPILGQQDLANPILSVEDLSMLKTTCQTLSGGFKGFWQSLFNRTIKTPSLN